eukprot:9496478-Pyramimonas_sp.AAC.1
MRLRDRAVRMGANILSICADLGSYCGGGPCCRAVVLRLPEELRRLCSRPRVHPRAERPIAECLCKAPDRAAFQREIG